MIHEKYFKLPLEAEEGYERIVFDADYNRAFDFLVGESNKQREIIDTLNGKGDYKTQRDLTHKDGDILADGKKIIQVRSWGRLTGTGGGLGLSSEKACEIQDSFCDWIINTLKR